MLRNEIKFAYRGADLAEACQAKVDHHTERKAYWEVEKDRAEEALKGSAVEFREHEFTGGKAIEAVIDPERQRHYRTCQEKVTHHDDRVETFDRWRRGFEHNSAEVFELDPDDVEYFGL